MSGRGKRNARGAPAEERPVKRGRTTNDDPWEKALDAAAHMLEEYPPVEIRDTDGIVAQFLKALPEGWTEDDEETVTKMWDDSGLKAKTASFSNPHSAPLLNVWKTSFRLFQRPPLGLVGVTAAMRYQPMTTHSRSRPHIPSTNFCLALSKLLVHPIWTGSFRRVTGALQYAIICRTGDYRALNRISSKAEECLALNSLNQGILKYRHTSTPHPLHKMHRVVRDQARTKGKEISPWSDFLFHSGETLENDTSKRPPILEEFTDFMGVRVLPLTLWDVEMVTKALGSMGNIETEYRMSVEDAFKAWNEQKSDRERPSMTQLPDLYEAFYKEAFREVVSFLKGQSQPQTGDSGSEDDLPESPIHGQNEEEMDVDSERSSSFFEEDNRDITMSDGDLLTMSDDDLLPPDEDQDESESSQEDDASESLGYEIEGPAMDNGDIPFVPGADEGGGMIDAETQLEGLGHMDVGTLSEPEVYNREISPTPQELAMPTGPPRPPRVPVLSELSPRGDYGIIVRLERENRELRDALNKAQEEVQKSEERNQRLQRVHEREIECLERTINNQTNMIESLDESRRDSRNGLDPTATQSDPVLIYLGRQVRRQRDEIEEGRQNLTRVESRFESRMNLLEREVMTQQLESGRLIESTELDSNLVSPGSGRAPSAMRDSPMQGD
ncbi:uncharacterized protein FIESC28_04943 [Fusarium coffeatum]|uniref:Uncharacterized protein n=1 Tax=Fusarium coffeatum TaxID=231269 RepID=A0A366RY51_9HYPO|nr:uncharacterized protein FIESC28_04943 [Fusarium coffeatum]RBR21406.1 hypothetical protein FIESC28_04943 [Fusarium coffeatum]